MKIWIVISLVIVIIIGISGFLAYNYFKPNIINLDSLNASIIEGKDFNNPEDLKSIIEKVEDKNILPANPRIKVFYQGVEVAYIDHLGNIFGSSGWFTNLNATTTNSTVFYETGSRLALNSSLSNYYLTTNPNSYINFTNLSDFGNNPINGSGNITSTGTGQFTKLIAGSSTPVTNAGFYSSQKGIFGDSITAVRDALGSGQRALALIDSAAVIKVFRTGDNQQLAAAIEFIAGNTSTIGSGLNNRWWDIGVDATGMYFRDRTTGTNTKALFIQDATRRVGIGTTSPSQMLDVNGNINATNYTGSWFKGAFDWIINTASANWMTFNGTDLTFNETQLNSTIYLEGERLGFNSTYNATYAGYATNVSINYTKQTYDTYNTAWSATGNSSYLLLSGGTMTGNLNFSAGSNITFGNNGNITNNVTCTIIRGSTSVLEIC